MQETTILRQIIQGKEPKIQSRVRTLPHRAGGGEGSEAGTRTFTTVEADELDISFHMSSDSDAHEISPLKPSHKQAGSKQMLALENFGGSQGPTGEAKNPEFHGGQDGAVSAGVQGRQEHQRSFGRVKIKRLHLLLGCVLATVAIVASLVGPLTRTGVAGRVAASAHL